MENRLILTVITILLVCILNMFMVIVYNLVCKMVAFILKLVCNFKIPGFVNMCV